MDNKVALLVALAMLVGSVIGFGASSLLNPPQDVVPSVDSLDEDKYEILLANYNYLNEKYTVLKEQHEKIVTERNEYKRKYEAVLVQRGMPELGKYLSGLGVKRLIVIQQGSEWADVIYDALLENFEGTIISRYRYGAGTEHFYYNGPTDADAVLVIGYTEVVKILESIDLDVPWYGIYTPEYAIQLRGGN